jgi:hydroxymethylbilane synthase
MKALDNASARLETTAERALLRRIEGGCQVPLGALARVEGDQLRQYSQVSAHDGSKNVTSEGTCAPNVAEATALGQKLAEDLLGKGAASIIAIERGTKKGVAPA